MLHIYHRVLHERVFLRIAQARYQKELYQQSHHKQELFLFLWFYTGIKITNEKEAKQAADKLINLGIKKIIITLGEKGLFYSDGKEEIYLQATPVKAIDTTGAGDAFNGGLAFGLSKEKPIKECLELANKVAGISTTKLGAGDAMPFIRDLS